jgi:hypothetical protein
MTLTRTRRITDPAPMVIDMKPDAAAGFGASGLFGHHQKVHRIFSHPAATVNLLLQYESPAAKALKRLWNDGNGNSKHLDVLCVGPLACDKITDVEELLSKAHSDAPMSIPLLITQSLNHRRLQRLLHTGLRAESVTDVSFRVR